MTAPLTAEDRAEMRGCEFHSKDCDALYPGNNRLYCDCTATADVRRLLDALDAAEARIAAALTLLDRNSHVIACYVREALTGGAAVDNPSTASPAVEPLAGAAAGGPTSTGQDAHGVASQPSPKEPAAATRECGTCGIGPSNCARLAAYGHCCDSCTHRAGA